MRPKLRSLMALAPILLAACVGREASELTSMPREHAGPLLALASGRTLAPVVDVEVFELGSALLPVPRALWTQKARAQVEPALSAIAMNRGVTLVGFPPPPDARRERALDALRDLVLTATLRPLRFGFERAAEERSGGPKIEATPLSAGAITALAEPIGADFVLFLFLRESRATETLRATNRRRAGYAAAAGLSTTHFFGVATAIAILVDLKEGKIVGMRGFVAGDPSPSLMDAAGAHTVVRAVLDQPGA